MWRLIQHRINDDGHFEGYAVNADGSEYIIYHQGNVYRNATPTRTADGKMVYDLVIVDRASQ